MKVIKRNNFRVVIDPELWYKEGHQRYETDAIKICNDIIDQVKRHCDDIRNIGFESDINEVCSHCGYTWEVDESGLPQCCNKAQEEFNQSKKF